MNRILTHAQIQHITRRIAYQIYETYIDEVEIVVAGIEKGGVQFAQKIAAVLKEITQAQIVLCTLQMNKQNPLAGEMTVSIPEAAYEGRPIVLVDDVLNSGTTLMYGVHHFLKTPVKQLKTAVLVNRNHKRFPIKADYKGISLSTSLNEHVRVDLTPHSSAAFLS